MLDRQGDAASGVLAEGDAGLLAPYMAPVRRTR